MFTTISLLGGVVGREVTMAGVGGDGNSLTDGQSRIALLVGPEHGKEGHSSPMRLAF